MDYDDNDFQSQNLHIAGEGGNKFPPILQSYVLPKFEFDDSLHGHLRFDNLVETEVFLGIESNEDNQWIEDFSRVSSGIQFSSTAAEPCSIPRHNNVWSEATSSESVEMLLKSVGQEETISVKTSVRESDACDELGCIMKQMEPNSNQEKTMTNTGDVQPTLSTCDIVDESPLLDGNDGVQQPVVSSAHKLDAPVDRGVDDATATATAEADLPLSAGGASADDKTNNNNRSEANDRTQRESVSGIEHNYAVQNISSSDNEFSENARNLITETANDGKNVSETENCKIQEKVSVLDQEVQMNDQALPENIVSSGSELENPVCSTTVQPVEDQSAVAASVDEDEHSCAMPKGNSGSSEHMVIGDQLDRNNEMSIMELERNAPSNSEKIKESEVSELDKNLGDHAHILSAEHHEDFVLEVVEYKNRSVDNSPNVDLVSSLHELRSEEHGKSIVSSPISIESTQVSEKDMLLGQNGVGKNDESVSVVGKDTVFTACGSHADTPDHELESAAGNDSQSAIVSASVDEVSMSSGIGITTDLIDSREEEKSPLPAVEKSSDAKTGEDAVSVTVGHMLLESANKSQPMVEACNVERQSDIQAIVSNKASQEFAKNTELHGVHYDSVENKGDVATVPGEENDKKAISTVLEADNSKEDQDKEATVNSGDASHEKLGALVINEHEREPDRNKATGDSQAVVGNRISESESEKDGMRRLIGQTVSAAEVTFVDANKVLTISQDPKQTDASKSDRGLSVEVSPLVNQPKKDATKTGSRKRGSKASLVMDGSLSTPGSGQSNSKVVQDVAYGNPKVSDVTTLRSGSKGTSDCRPRRTSGKSTGKDKAKKGTPAKETASVRLGDKIGNVSMSQSGISQLVLSNEIPHYVHTDSGGLKPFVLATSASGLPDLNSASSVVFQQPFTDLQQVQLRAQIFVYGALIQGTVPDEPYMISAFGGPDGGRNIWESAWRSCMERLHSQKSRLFTPETPVQSRSGVKVMPSARNSKGTPTTIVSPMLPVSTPLWNLSTPTGDALQSSSLPRGSALDYQRALSPLHPHQTPPARNFVGHNPSWISQPPFGPWVGAPHSSAIDVGGCFSVHLPATEAVQLTPVNETVPHPSTAKHVTPGPVVHSEASAGGFTGISPVMDVKKIAASSGQSSVDPKPRKRKKTSDPENKRQNILQSLHQTVLVPSPVTGSQLSAAAIAVPVGFGSLPIGENLITAAPPVCLIDMAKGSQNAEQRPILSEETLGRVKEARMKAEDAAGLAADAVNRSQEMWNQLEKQRSSGLLFDVEAKLASAAVAIAAAAAVAKAAAAVANVASNAALQAKLMADEAIASGSSIQPVESNVILNSGVRNLGNATPASILKGDGGTNASSSILVAAREAAKKRVEAASAASKRAENMDAIVKAAELAAEAVSQAGKIVAMGDPLPLGELIAAGPGGCWKSNAPSGLCSQLKEVEKDSVNIDNAGAPETFANLSKIGSLEKRDTLVSNRGKQSTPNENFVEDHARLIDSLQPSRKVTKGQMGNKVIDLAKTIGVIPESESGQKLSFAAQGDPEIALEASKDGRIQEGSHVEVFKDGNGFKAAWLPASVLSLKDGKAYVSYNDLTTGEGSEKLKEWVALQSEGNRAPEIRLARPVIAMPSEGTRKRRRANLGEYNWLVGDRVEAWIQDSWWEGVITDKNKKDETTLTVNFPVQGDTSVVRAWNLRPLLVWKDGEWVEWSSSREKDHSVHSGDTPQEKRPRRQSPSVEVKGKDTMSASIGTVGSSDKPQEPTLLELTADEKAFNIGKSNRDGNKPDTLRMTRTGLKKEGSKVIFGVPKPGKKRKFMEVSKHYVADKSGKREAGESVKFAKNLMPQGTGSRGWKNPSKNEPIGKHPIISKPRGVRSGKVQNVSGSASNDRAGTENFVKNKDSGSHGEDASGKQNTGGFQSVSSSEGAADSMVFSSMDVTADTLTSKKTSTSNAKPERVSKGKLAPAGRKFGKIEEEKSTMDPIEPRRSNRRIQPTSRLLEGLQSSLMVSKIPSLSHDKSHKNRNASRGNN